MNPTIYQPLSTPIGIAVLSFAHGHANAYCNSIKEFDDARVLAAWDDNSERGQKAAEQFGLQLYSNVDELLARDDIQAVIITSETNRHVDFIEKSAAAGKAILCQKPMATTVEDCDRIIEAVERHGVHFQMAFQMRADPLNQQIKQWLDEGAVGKVGMIRRRHCINFLFNPPAPGSGGAWHIDPVANVGMFFDDAVHAADFLYWLLGKPVSVMAEIDNVLTDVAPDDTGVAIYRWSNGIIGALENSSVTLAAENTCEIYGDEGVIIQNYDDLVSTQHSEGRPALRLYRKSTSSWENFDFELPPHHGVRIGGVPRPWIDLLKAGAAPSADARVGKISVEMCAAAYQSSREGRRVQI
jgi:predicted dehydrogenase